MTDSDRSPAIDVVEAERRLHEGGEDGGADSGSGPILLDVREPAEFDMVRAEGARLLPLSAFLASYQSLPLDRPLMVICATGSRSGQATAYLLAHGWTDVVNVTGGTTAWQRAGLPTRSGPLAAGEGDLGF
jgi:rhodanese-related sulfurtransferase